MKALVIKIRDAGLFKTPSISGSQDKMVDVTGKTTRFNKRDKTVTPYLKVPAGQLSYQHVANLLRVLWGQRPVPSLRKVHDAFTGDPYFEELAKKVLVKIETPILPSGKGKGHDLPYYPEETTTIRKSVGDSWQTMTRPYLLDGSYVQIKGGLLYPDRVLRYLGSALYDQFTILVKNFGEVRTVQEAMELLNANKTDSRVVAFCRACVEGKRTSFSNIILNVKAESITMHTYTSKCPLNTLMAMGTIETLEKFSATLYVPVTEEDLIKINESTGVATFLEGGFVNIEGVEDWSPEIFELSTKHTTEGKLCI
jgi:hypothetical protein